MKQHPAIFLLFCVTTALIFLSCTGCGDDQTQWDTSTRGNSDANINNLGLAAETDENIYYVGTETSYDLIYQADENGAPQKAITGLSGYIQFLNIIDNSVYFLGVTYDEGENRSEAIFSASLNGEDKNCVYTMDAGTSTSYLAAVGDLLIYAAADENGKTKVGAVNPLEKTEAELFTEKETIRSLQIYNGRFYYITGNTIRSVAMDGSDKKVIYESEDWIGNLLILKHSLYFTKSIENDTGHSDIICKINKKGENYEEVFTRGKWIANVNGNDQMLYFADHAYDGEGNFKEAVFYQLNIESAIVTEIGRTETEYTGFELCGNQLIYHLNDETLTAKTIPLKTK